MAHKATIINRMSEEDKKDVYLVDDWVCVIWKDIARCVDVVIAVDHHVDLGFIGEVIITAPKKADTFERVGIKLKAETLQEALENMVSKVLRNKGIELECPTIE